MWKPCCEVDGGTTCFSTTPDSPSWRSIPSGRSRIVPGGRGHCTSPTWVCEACRAAGSRILQSLSPPKQVDQRQHSLKLMPDQQSVASEIVCIFAVFSPAYRTKSARKVLQQWERPSLCCPRSTRRWATKRGRSGARFQAVAQMTSKRHREEANIEQAMLANLHLPRSHPCPKCAATARRRAAARGDDVIVVVGG